MSFEYLITNELTIRFLELLNKINRVPDLEINLRADRVFYRTT